FDFIPGPLVRSTKEIVDVINAEQFEMEKIPPFVDYFFNGTLGHASENVVDEVIIPSLEDYYEEKESDKEILPPRLPGLSCLNGLLKKKKIISNKKGFVKWMETRKN